MKIVAALLVLLGVGLLLALFAPWVFGDPDGHSDWIAIAPLLIFPCLARPQNRPTPAALEGRWRMNVKFTIILLTAILALAGVSVWLTRAEDHAAGYAAGVSAGRKGAHICHVVDNSPSSDFTAGALRGWADSQKQPPSSGPH
jgi:hypothetical protein